jgi:hypothetical protein
MNSYYPTGIIYQDTTEFSVGGMFFITLLKYVYIEDSTSNRALAISF